ncbi:hypothetical protein BKA93DRAFT_845915 [Sparassis latifolia]
MVGMHETKLSKGKAREDIHWQLGWWDLCRSSERPRSPLVWSKSSLIFTAHPSQPLVLASHFPSSKQFIVPSPSPVASSPASYEPPTIISVSPTDDWLFAYFPGRGGDGAGCLWKRGPQLDSWVVREWWSFAVGAGVVAADWTSGHREWVVTDSGSSVRLPPRGPVTSVSNPTLLLITQSHQINICCLPPSVPSMKILRGSLLQYSAFTESQSSVAETSYTGPGPGGVSLCTDSAIGLSYDKPFIIVAMRSRLLPSYSPTQAPYSSMDIDLSLDITDSGILLEAILPPEGELWGEESVIRLCKVSLDLRAMGLTVMIEPLPPITGAGSHLTDLAFLSVPSTQPDIVPVEVTPGARQDLYLTASFIDPGDYSSMPKTELVLYTFTATDQPTGSGGSSQVSSHLLTPQEDFILPCTPRGTLLAGFMDPVGAISHKRSQAKEVCVGRITALKLPDLSDLANRPMISNEISSSMPVPVNAAISPNSVLLCTLPSSSFLGTPVSIHSLPPYLPPTASQSKTAPSILGLTSDLELPSCIVASIRSRKSPSDIIHSLSTSLASVDMLSSTLHGAASILDSDSFGLSEMWLKDTFGIATEVYLTKSRRTNVDAEKIDLIARWKAAHDACSLTACCSAFEECQELVGYDLDAVWHLVGLSSWLIEFTESLLKECVLAGDDLLSSGAVKDEPGNGTSYSKSTFGPPMFLHLVHPYCLNKLHAALAHVKRFRDHVASLPAGGENAQIAKEVLMDVVDDAGLDLAAFVRVLSEVIQEANHMDADALRRSLADCRPASSLIPHLRKIVRRILDSNVIDRPRLFLKPTDLVDGVARASVSERQYKGKDRDVVTKGVLPHNRVGAVCLRCGGKSEVPSAEPFVDASVPWRVWEQGWTVCICGGSWLRTTLGHA